MKNLDKYKNRIPAFTLPDRQWPSQTITQTPIWCSVDLRDGNQALETPMGVDAKLEFFKELVNIGFKQIEIGFPAASDTEYAFVRRLIEEGHIPDDVTIQILCQCREELIIKSLESLKGAKNVIFHLYNSTSPNQRQITFDNASVEDIAAMGMRGVNWLIKHSTPLVAAGAQIQLEYSPESFSNTEMQVAADVCNRIIAVWKPGPSRKMIINLPDTVQYSAPNVYADQIEWMCRNLKDRGHVTVSLHTHNDCGTGVAATEMGILAGADRVEGTLFGNGERTGNCDLVTVALNLYSRGIEPGLDFSQLQHTREVYERCTNMTIPPRQPYAGDLVFTAFSGSHQDAIKKGLSDRIHNSQGPWIVPYLHIDPTDMGCVYQPVRVNSQSGKGGAAFLLQQETGFALPKGLERDFGNRIKTEADQTGQEISVQRIAEIFQTEYVNRGNPLALDSMVWHENGNNRLNASLILGSQKIEIAGCGMGPIEAFYNALRKVSGFPEFSVANYHQDAIGSGGVASKAVCYLTVTGNDQKNVYGVGVDSSIDKAAIRAVLSAINRSGLVKPQDLLSRGNV